MACLIGSANVKIFGKTIHALARIADEVYIETLSSGLILHSINSSKSAYATFTFKPDFFVSYKYESLVKRKLLLKSCLVAFRSIPNLEKNIEQCLFDLTKSADYLLLKFFCKHGMVKVYHLYCVENQNFKLKFPASGFLCTLTAASRLLQDAIQNFSASVEELTLTVFPNKVLLRNYVDDEPDPKKVVHTELSLESEEFEAYEVQQEVKITFFLKELKAALNFCEGFNIPISIKCQDAGRPVFFDITGLREVEVQFVLATLVDGESQSVSSSNSVMRSSVTKEKMKRKKSTRPEKVSTPAPPGDSFSRSFLRNGLQRNPLNLSDEEDDMPLNLDPLNDEDLDHIPSTPPHKKFRAMFLGLSQSTCTSVAPDPDEVLVPNSDEEDT